MSRRFTLVTVTLTAPLNTSAFDSLASEIDTDGDLEADVAFHVLFASSAHGEATATVYKASGAAARETGAVGEAVIADAPVSMNGSASARSRFAPGRTRTAIQFMRRAPLASSPSTGCRSRGRWPFSSHSLSAGPISNWISAMAD